MRTINFFSLFGDISGQGNEIIPLKTANKIIDKLLDYESALLLEIDHLYINDSHKEVFKQLLSERINRLRK